MGQVQTVGSIHTTISADETHNIVKYHQTEVVKWNAKEIVLDSGGYRTYTTKTRMNQTSNQFNLGYQVFQKDYEWYVEWQGKVYTFYDGIILERG